LIPIGSIKPRFADHGGAHAAGDVVVAGANVGGGAGKGGVEA
jgi:hypothetical protein